MPQTYLQRERRDAISAWLFDRFGPREGPDRRLIHYSRDAEDLIKFLRANGFRIVREGDDD